MAHHSRKLFFSAQFQLSRLNNHCSIVITGLCIAQVHAIFNLPPQFGQLPHLLVYIEWFMALGQINPVTGMYSVQHSTCHHHPNAKIVVVDCIVQSAHLMAKSGHELNRDWTTSNVLEKAEIFWVNPYINVDMFIVTWI